MICRSIECHYKDKKLFTALKLFLIQDQLVFRLVCFCEPTSGSLSMTRLTRFPVSICLVGCRDCDHVENGGNTHCPSRGSYQRSIICLFQIQYCDSLDLETVDFVSNPYPSFLILIIATCCASSQRSAEHFSKFGNDSN